jgi:DNA-binding MarR family transcriptional regulator
MWMWMILALTLVALPCFLYFVARRSEEETIRDWELVLTPKGREHLEAVRSYTSTELALLDWTYERAREAEDLGRTEEALRLLDTGCRLIEAYCPSWTRSLSAMSVLSRMVSAMANVRPLRPQAFRLRELAQLARLNQFVHQFLVTTGERFRLRLYILARAFGTLLRIVMLSRAHVKTRVAAPNWEAVEAARRDVHTLSDESIETFRLLLASLEAERRLAPSS